MKRTTLALTSLVFIACGGSSEEPAKAPVAATAPSAQPAPVASAAPVKAPAPIAQAPAAPKAPPAPATLTSKSVAIPGSPKPLSFDYLAADRAAGKIYLPVGNTGSLDIFDVATGDFTQVSGFKTAEREYKGKKRMAGPSAVAVGDGVAYVNNRASNEICVVDTKSMKLGSCTPLKTGGDGVAYVVSTKELWVTTPREQSITVFDAKKPTQLKQVAVIKLAGDPEGYAEDVAKGLFFTNLEDKGPTVVIDTKTHKVKSTWNPGCGEDGPRGIAVDPARNFVFVACTDHLQVLDGGHDGALLGKLDTGAGVDNIDFVSESSLLVMSAGKASRITVASFNEKGEATVVATGTSALGARNAVADRNGNVYVPDPEAGALLVLGQ